LTTNGHTLAVGADGNAYCWGDNQQGQCGLGTTGTVTSPTEVPGLQGLDQALAGGQYSVFLDSSGRVWACGDNAKGQVGNGSTSNQLTVVSVLKGMTMISAGAGHAVAAN
jgi:alpha-tubulin suppressor-like RCC1 family protein